MTDVGTLIGATLVVIGIGLFVGELLHPGIFLLIPGTVILVSGVMYILLPGFLTDSILGPALVMASALVATVVSILYYQHVAPVHPPMVTMPATLAGSEGLVIAPVLPDSMKGKVRVRSEVWSACPPGSGDRRRGRQSGRRAAPRGGGGSSMKASGTAQDRRRGGSGW